MNIDSTESNRLNPAVAQDILFIAPVPPPITGQSVACKALYDDLVVCGYRVRLVNLSKGTLKQGVSSISRFWEIARLLARTLRLRSGVHRVYLTPAESIAGNLKDILIYLALGARRSVTYIHLHGGGGMRVLLSDQHPWLCRINSWFLRQMAGVIVLGDSHVSIYDKLVDFRRIHVVKNFAPDEAFIGDQDLENKLADLSVIRVLFLSNLIPGKGYEDLLSAVDMINPEVKGRVSFDFAGGFESEAARVRFMKQIGNLDNVIYHGVVDGEEKRTLLQKADVFCLPSYLPEGQPISILEAYAAGCAVMTTDCGGIFDIFTPEANGIVVETRSPSSIARSVERLINDADTLRRFARYNVEDARMNYRKNQHLHRLRNTLMLD